MSFDYVVYGLIILRCTTRYWDVDTSEMKVARIELDEAQRAELENGYRKGEKHCFRMRCLAVLLKTEGFSSSKVGVWRSEKNRKSKSSPCRSGTRLRHGVFCAKVSFIYP